MIQTTEFALTKKEYLKILVLLRLRSSWLIYLLMIAASLFYLPRFDSDSIAKFVVLFPPGFLLLIFLYLINYVNSKDNRNIYIPRRLTFDEEKITAYSGKEPLSDTPTTSEIANNQIIKTKRVGEVWLLYVAKSIFVIVPESVFTSKEDMDRFKKLYHLQ